MNQRGTPHEIDRHRALVRYRRRAGHVHAAAGSAHLVCAFERGEPVDDDPQFGFGRKLNAFPPVKNVRVVAGGETLRVGEQAITAHLMPGHTPGSTTWTWRSCEANRCLDVVYADSLTSCRPRDSPSPAMRRTRVS